jgi:hypothetical protein
VEFNREGQILYRYHPAAGPGMLDHPSLTELLPSGVFMANDDSNHRMAPIDPVTGATMRGSSGGGRMLLLRLCN